MGPRRGEGGRATESQGNGSGRVHQPALPGAEARNGKPEGELVTEERDALKGSAHAQPLASTRALLRLEAEHQRNRKSPNDTGMARYHEMACLLVDPGEPLRLSHGTRGNENTGRRRRAGNGADRRGAGRAGFCEGTVQPALSSLGNELWQRGPIDGGFLEGRGQTGGDRGKVFA